MKRSVAVVPVAPSATLGESMASVGASSSSMIVSVASAGFAMPPSPDTVAETVADPSGASTASSTAVPVTVPVLAVEPAATVSVFAVESVKPSPVAETVSVTVSLDARFSTAVTVETPPSSEMDDGDRARVAAGAPSSSLSVRLAPVTVPMP